MTTSLNTYKRMKIKMGKTGINIKRCNCKSATEHNERTQEYLEALERSGKKKYEIFHDRTSENSHWINDDYVGKTLEQILDDCRERYKKTTGQKPQEEDRVRVVTDKKTGLKKTVTTSGWSPIREGVCPIKDDTTIEDFKRFVVFMESKGVHVIRIDIHRDEGYEDPVTGERKYNLHAHIVIDWTDRETGKTAKLNKDDMSDIQTALADSLGMERGEAKGDDGPDHLSAEEYREKKARENADKIEQDIKKLKLEIDQVRQSIEEAQQLEAEAKEKAAAAEKAAKQLRSNAADVGARILGVFGHGAIAEAEAGREAAEKEAAEARAAEEAAKNEAAEARAAEEAAHQAKLEANTARDKAISEKRAAEEQKEEHGRKKYHAGRVAGYDEGKEAAAVEISKLKKQMAAEKEQSARMLDAANAKAKRDQAEMQSHYEQQLKQANERAESAETEIKKMMILNPYLQNWLMNLKEVNAAGMKQDDAFEVFRRGYKKDTEVSFTYNAKMHKCTADVYLQKDKSGTMRVWFNGLRYKAFVEKAVASLKQTGPKL